MTENMKPVDFIEAVKNLDNMVTNEECFVLYYYQNLPERVREADNKNEPYSLEFKIRNIKISLRDQGLDPEKEFREFVNAADG